MNDIRLNYDMEIWGYMISLLLILGVAFVVVLKDIGILQKVKDSMRISIIHILRNMQARQKLQKKFRMEYRLHYKMQKIRNRRRLKQRMNRIWQQDGKIATVSKRVAH